MSQKQKISNGVKIRIILCCALSMFSIPFASKGAVVINEIMYDLKDGQDDGREWVEIFNNSTTTVDLSGWKLWENGTNHGLTIVQGDINLPQNGYAIIIDKLDKFLIDNPGYSGTLFDSTFSLSNSGESLILKDKNLTTIDEVLYSSSWGASGNGRSLQRKDLNGGSSDPNNWGSGDPTPGNLNNISPEEPASTSEESTTETTTQTTTSNQPPIAKAGNNIIAFIDEEITFDGSKSHDPDGLDLAYEWNLGEGGVEDDAIVTHKYSYPGTYLVTLTVFDGRYYVGDTITVEIYPKKITINEFLPSPIGKDEEEEWIEIYNDSDSIVNISGWQLDDEDGGGNPFVFPKNTLIAPKSYLVFSRQTTKIALNNDKDKVRLLLSSGVVFQEISYEKAPQGKSSARTPGGFVWSAPTPGIANIVIDENEEFDNSKSLQSEITEYSIKETAIISKNNPDNSIRGGVTYSSNQKDFNTGEMAQEEKQNDRQFTDVRNLTANLKGVAGKINYKLIIILIAIIFVSLIIGIGAVKLRKKIKR